MKKTVCVFVALVISLTAIAQVKVEKAFFQKNALLEIVKTPIGSISPITSVTDKNVNGTYISFLNVNVKNLSTGSSTVGLRIKCGWRHEIAYIDKDEIVGLISAAKKIKSASLSSNLIYSTRCGFMIKKFGNTIEIIFDERGTYQIQDFDLFITLLENANKGDSSLAPSDASTSFKFE